MKIFNNKLSTIFRIAAISLVGTAFVSGGGFFIIIKYQDYRLEELEKERAVSSSAPAETIYRAIAASGSDITSS